MATTMTVQCPSCETAFPVDPDKVPEGGAKTQCTMCDTFFRVDHAGAHPWAPPQVQPPEAPGEEPWWTPEEADEAPDGEFATEEHADVTLDEALEPSLEEVEPLEAMEAGEPEDGAAAGQDEVVEPAPGADDDWSTSLGDDWILERDEDATFGDLDLEVERLDTVEESQRTASHEESFTSYMEGEVVLTPEDLDAGLEGEGEVELDEGLEVVEQVGDFTAFGEMGVEVELEGGEAEPEAAETSPPLADEEPAAPEGFQFGRRDPHDKARRLARVLVSDMITYNPDRHVQALGAGTLAQDFEEEIDKSWAEYVEQVGQDLAESTSYWRDALNEILAKGQPLF